MTRLRIAQLDVDRRNAARAPSIGGRCRRFASMSAPSRDAIGRAVALPVDRRTTNAVQALAKLQRELRRKEAIEFVGLLRPKLPRTRHIPFREEDVLRLESSK
jgi:hypothetical protein